MQERGRAVDHHDPATWSELMARAQAGDKAAYALLLRELSPLISRYVGRRIFNPATTEEVVQEILITIHRVRHTYDPERPLMPWVYAIASARTVDAIRKLTHRSRWETEFNDEFERWPDDMADRGLSRVESRQELERLLRTLPDRQRALVELVHLEELSLAEAANASRLTVSAVKSLLHRALKALRKNGV